ncbi:nickel ABC transporter substrate-binding protein, partial [Desulfosarcina sp. OttesenSCG-928-A07]|nr:nickel ABC transporter substrate-binding protein [Desulfosarcina sp. OttesenSCG-928-A07]
MRRLTLFFLCWFGAALLMAAGSAFAEPDKTTIVYSHLSNVGPLNPHMYSPNQMFAQTMVYEALVRLETDGSIAPSLAERWDISPDGTRYTFFLRKDVTFSDGQPFDAHAVEKNFRAILGNAKRHQWLGITDKIQAYEAIDAHTFQLTLSAPYYPCLLDLSMTRPFRMLSPAAFPDDGDTSKGIKAPVGTGPWKLTKIALGQYDRFERNETYWGAKPKAKIVLVKVIPDPVSRTLAFETGEIDLIYGLGQINFDAFSRLRRMPGVSTAVSGPMGTMSLALNSGAGPTKDLEVRQAIQHFTDKDALIKGVTLNSQPKADTLFSPSIPYCDMGLPAYAFDLEKAETLLDAAGWKQVSGKKIREKDGVPLVIDCCFIGNDAAHKAIAEVLQAQAAKAGVALNLIGEEPDSFYRRQKTGDFGMIVNSTWGPPSEPHAMVSSMLLPSHADYMAQSGLSMKPEIDGWIRDALVSIDETERTTLYRRILTTLHEQA